MERGNEAVRKVYKAVKVKAMECAFFAQISFQAAIFQAGYKQIGNLFSIGVDREKCGAGNVTERESKLGSNTQYVEHQVE